MTQRKNEPVNTFNMRGRAREREQEKGGKGAGKQDKELYMQEFVSSSEVFRVLEGVGEQSLRWNLVGSRPP